MTSKVDQIRNKTIPGKLILRGLRKYNRYKEVTEINGHQSQMTPVLMVSILHQNSVKSIRKQDPLVIASMKHTCLLKNDTNFG